MITLKNLTLQRGVKLLLDKVSVSIFASEKVGLIGINGCGKSSLFALILGQLQPDGGEISIQSNIRIAHLSQQIPHSDLSAIQYVMRGDQALASLLDQLQRAEVKEDHVKAATLHGKLYEMDGYSAEAKAAKILHGLGFSQPEYAKTVNEFSGGWRMRLNLGSVLMCRSDLLLLDEPTNHLDLDTIVWLESQLQRYDGTLLLISHDREFLDNVIHKVLHVQNQQLDLYTGNYSDFEELRAQKLALEAAAYEKQQAKIEHLTKFVNRFRAKASKAKQAQSRLKALEKMERVSITRMNAPFSFKFYEAAPCSPPLLRFNDIGFSYGDHRVLDHVDFSLDPGDRIGLLGPNGAGKSTLMKLLSGKLKIDVGDSSVTPAIKIGYFAQHQLDQLNLEESAFEHIKPLDKKATEQSIRTFLGGFGFRDEMVFGSITNFSGGEKARLVLAMLVWQKPNLLLLDEPTNHLDLDMRETLDYALQSYTGTLVLVSHDRHLLKSTVDDFYLVYDHQVKKFEGDLNDYQR